MCVCVCVFFSLFFSSSFSCRRVVESVTLVLVLACPGARGNPTQSPPPTPFALLSLPPCLTLSLSCCVVMCHVLRQPHQLATTKYTTQQRCLPTSLCTCFRVVPAATPAGYDEVHHPATMLAYIPVYMPFVWSRRPYQMTTTKYTTQERCLPTFLCTCFLCGPGGHTN